MAIQKKEGRAQHLLRFTLPEGVRIYPSDFRKSLAGTNQLRPEFFHYDPDTGHPVREGQNKSAIPGIRIVGGRTWVGVLASPSCKDLLDQSIPTIIYTISGICKKPVATEFSSYTFAIHATQTPIRYRVREMVIKKGAKKDMPEAERIALIKSRIQQAIYNQAKDHGMDCPTNEQLGVMISKIERPRGLRIVSRNGETNQFAELVDVEFYVHAMLKGFWFAGNLTARGYGRIIQWFQGEITTGEDL